jgi:translation initiation factor IF-1
MTVVDVGDLVVVVATATNPADDGGLRNLFPLPATRGRLTFWRVLGDVTNRCSRSLPNRHMKKTPVEVEGIGHTVLPGTMFRVELDKMHLVLATRSEGLRQRSVRLAAGDRVERKRPTHHLDKARIVWQLN